MFGHLNNAVFYEFFDAAINGWIITNTGIDPLTTSWLRCRRRVRLPILL